MADDIWQLLVESTGFDWDEGNAPKVAERHGVEPGECEQVFFREPFLVNDDETHSSEEPRWQALGGTSAGRQLFLVFTVRGSLIRVIAARDMNRRERKRYAEAEASVEEDSEVPGRGPGT